MDIIQLLSAYLQLKTVTAQRQQWSSQVFGWIVSNLANPIETFGVTWEVFPDAQSLVIKVPAANGDLRRPVLFLHHADVVTGRDFSGQVKDGCLWGRGALDMKSALIMQLWALRQFLQFGGRLKRSLVFLINTDEETGGEHSCQAMARDHWDQLGNPGIVVDEGSFIFKDFLGVCLAPIVVAEKAAGTLKVSAEDSWEFLQALYRLASWQTPYTIHPAVAETLRRVFRAKGRAWVAPLILVLGRLPLFGPWLLAKVFSTATVNAMVRNIINLTQLGRFDGVGNVAGTLEMVFRDHPSDRVYVHKLPSNGRHASMPDPQDQSVAQFLKQAMYYIENGYRLNDPLRAGFNVRLLPGQDPTQFLAAVRAIAGPRVQLELELWPGCGGQTSWDTDFFQALERTLQLDDLVTAPAVTTATTDSRYFESRGAKVYRIIPVMVDQELLATIHGAGERVLLEELERGVKVYGELYRRL